MTILKSFWHYWKWLCVALVSTVVVLYPLALVVQHFSGPDVTKEQISRCIDHGGTWDDEAKVCKQTG